MARSPRLKNKLYLCSPNRTSIQQQTLRTLSKTKSLPFLMRTIEQDNTPTPCAATIGSFDGVHKGHQHVIHQLADIAHSRQLEAVAVTFANHPLQVLRRDLPVMMLTNAEEKKKLLTAAGADKVIVLTFTPEMAVMNAETFMTTFLCGKLNVKTLLMGYDNHIGHDRLCFDECAAIGRKIGIEVVGCDEWRDREEISSTSIRHSIMNGYIEGANAKLGYEYHLTGHVVEGFHNGRKMGFPTANIETESGKVIPATGVYAVRVKMPDEQGSVRPGMLNIGTRPTLHNGNDKSIEVHIFDYQGFLYGKRLSVTFVSRLRQEREFDSIDELIKQLTKDETECRRILSSS